MPAVRHCSRIDTFDLKLQMERRLGSQKAENYFNLLTRYLSLKLGKLEFDKLCILLIGNENIRFHNELIRAIIKNATVSKTPPQKQVKRDSLLTYKDPNDTDPRNNLQSLCRDVFLQSPKKVRTPNLRERKFKDRPSPLGINEKTQEQLLSLGSKPSIEVNYVENKEKIPITAPFGINLHSYKKRKVLHNGLFSGTNSLENRLKQKLKTEGLDISMDCVNLLNNGLDSYLKSVIKPSLELAGSRSLNKPGKRFKTSMLDFRVATETNSKILGEDWRIQLDKIGFNDSLEFMSE